MVFLRGVKILGAVFTVSQQGKGAYSVLAGVEKIHHWFSISVKCQTVVTLHPTGKSFVVAGLKVNIMPVSCFNNWDRQLRESVCLAANDVPFQFCEFPEKYDPDPISVLH